MFLKFIFRQKPYFPSFLTSNPKFIFLSDQNKFLKVKTEARAVQLLSLGTLRNNFLIFFSLQYELILSLSNPSLFFQYLLVFFCCRIVLFPFLLPPKNNRRIFLKRSQLVHTIPRQTCSFPNCSRKYYKNSSMCTI